jgi:hypothetical protein
MNKLLELDKNACEQLEIIEQKIRNIHEVRSDLEDLLIRIRSGITKLDEEGK